MLGCVTCEIVIGVVCELVGFDVCAEGREVCNRKDIQARKVEY